MAFSHLASDSTHPNLVTDLVHLLVSCFSLTLISTLYQTILELSSEIQKFLCQEILTQFFSILSMIGTAFAICNFHAKNHGTAFAIRIRRKSI